jgi:hypothetical protein
MEGNTFNWNLIKKSQIPILPNPKEIPNSNNQNRYLGGL